MENEIVYNVYGKRFGKYFIGYMSDFNEGKPTSVECILDKVMEKPSSVLGFYHTHPSMPNNPSLTDYQTMNGMTFTVGRDMLCAIDGENGLAGWWFSNQHENFYTGSIKRIGKVLVGKIHDNPHTRSCVSG